MLKIVAVSDLHLGEPDSVLHLNYPHLLVRFAQRLHALAGASDEAKIDTLLLMGDIPDYTLASWDTCHRNLRMFFDAILVGAFACPADGKSYEVGVKTQIDHVVYVPGNHDHMLWTHILEQILVAQGVKLQERDGYRYGLGRMVVKDPSLDAQHLRWVPFDTNGEGSPVEVNDVPFLYRTDAARPQWSLAPTNGAEAVLLADYFFGREAVRALKGFTIQYPHVYTPIADRGFLFQHGQYLSPTVVGKASNYAPKGMESLGLEGASSRSDAAQALESLFYGAGLEAGPGRTSSQGETPGEPLDALLAALSPEELQLLAQALEIPTAEKAAAAPGLEGVFDPAAAAVKRLLAIKDKLSSTYRCFAKYRPKLPLAEKTFDEVEAKTARFMDTLWEPAGNDDRPLNDQFWNAVGRGEKFAEAMKWRFNVQSNHKIADGFRFLLERYLEKLTGRLPQELVFVFGDTHEAAERIFEHVQGTRRVHVFNTGAWHSKVRDWQHGAKLFTVTANGSCELMNIEFTPQELAVVSPFDKRAARPVTG